MGRNVVQYKCKGEAPASLNKGGLSMNISIIGRQMTVSDDLKVQVEKKLSRFDKFFPDGADATVTFSKLREKECLEIMISYKGMLLRSEEKNLTFLNALDECVEIIDGQIRKNKTRLEKRMKTGVVVPDDSDDMIEEEGEFNIRTKAFPMRPMSPEEAILQMNLLGHSFFMFANAETGDTCVVYKRKDNDYGMITPL